MVRTADPTYVFAMKMVRLSDNLELKDLLREAADEEDLILLDEQGQPRFALLATVDREMDFDQEIRALRANPEFMTALTAWEDRASTERCESPESIREANEGLDKILPEILGRLTDSEANEVLAKVGIDPARYGMERSKDLIDHWQRCVLDLTASE
jgi:hypothetical protein